MKKFKFTIDGNAFEATVNELENHQLEVEVNGSSYTVEVNRAATKTSNQQTASAAKTAGKVAPIATQPVVAAASSAAKTAGKAATTATQPVVAATTSVKTVKSQLPGSIVKVLVEVGQTVAKGDVIMTIESMKMENNIMAETGGRIVKIYVEPGKNVMQDDKLVDMEISAGTSAPEPPKTAPKPAPAPAPTASAADGKPLKSPLPGSIIKILVTEGQAVKRGDILLTMESMKMENEIKAEKDGTVTAIKIAVGQNVMQDDTLLLMA